MADGQVIIQVKSNAKQAASDFNKLDKSLDNTTREAKKTDKTMDGLSGTLGALGGVIATVGLFELGKQAVQTGFKFTALENKFKAAAGSAENGAASFEFIRETAKELGLELTETADAYAGFTAAATRSGLTFEQTEQIFKDVAMAATSLQLSGERVGLVFKALEQISSKGVVSMEELKLQLGDSLPGAVQIAAKSMGMTTSAFIDAVSAGEVMSKDFLPKFAEQIRTELGGSAEDAANSLQSAFNRVGNSFKTLQSELTREGSAGNTVLKFMAIGLEEVNTQLAMFIGNSDAIKLEGARRELADTNLEIQELSEKLNEISLQRANRSFDFLKEVDTEKINILKGDMDELIAKRNELSQQITDLTPKTTDLAGSEEETPASKEINKLKDLQDEAAKTKIQLQNLFLSGEEDTDQFASVKAQYEGVTAQIKAAQDATKVLKQDTEDSFGAMELVADAFSRNAARSLFEPFEEGETALDRFKDIAIKTFQDIAAEVVAAAIKAAAFRAVLGIATGGSSEVASFSSLFAGNLGLDANAKGGAFSGVKEYAKGGIVGSGGGVVSSPTFFNAGGQLSVAGEAGDEVIAPAKRMRNGDMGVQVAQTPVVNNIYNNAPVQVETVSRPNNQNDIYISLVNNALSSSQTSVGVSDALSRTRQSGNYGV